MNNISQFWLISKIAKNITIDKKKILIGHNIIVYFIEAYRRHPGEHNIYTSLYDPDRSKSANPNVYFYKTAGYPQGFIY